MSSTAYSSYRSSSSRPIIHNSYTPSVSSVSSTATMSSRNTSSGSDRSYRDPTQSGQFRDPRAADYSGNYTHRDTHREKVTVLNYPGAVGYDKNAPTAGYSVPKRESSKK